MFVEDIDATKLPPLLVSVNIFWEGTTNAVAQELTTVIYFGVWPV